VRNQPDRPTKTLKQKPNNLDGPRFIFGAPTFRESEDVKHTTFTADEFEPAMSQHDRSPMPVSVQILSTLLYGAFAIVSVIIALNMFWPAGVVLAAILGWRGGFVPQNFTQVSAAEIAEKVRTLGPEAAQRSSGNASFDAYKQDIMQRLEDEQDSISGSHPERNPDHDLCQSLQC